MRTDNSEKMPTVELGERINVGRPGRSAVVCNIRNLGDIEVVYLDRDRAINEDVVWRDGAWDFKRSSPAGGYADNSERLRHYVGILRRGSN
jgi:hypothetical protein